MHTFLLLPSVGEKGVQFRNHNKIDISVRNLGVKLKENKPLKVGHFRAQNSENSFSKAYSKTLYSL